MNEIEAKAAMAILTVHLIEWAKNSPHIKLIGPYTTTLTRLIAGLISVLTSAGVHFTLNGTFSSGGSTTITWPPADVIITGIWQWALQWGMQQMYLRNVVENKPTVKITADKSPVVELNPTLMSMGVLKDKG